MISPNTPFTRVAVLESIQFLSLIIALVPEVYLGPVEVVASAGQFPLPSVFSNSVWPRIFQRMLYKTCSS